MCVFLTGSLFTMALLCLGLLLFVGLASGGIVVFVATDARAPSLSAEESASLTLFFAAAKDSAVPVTVYVVDGLPPSSAISLICLRSINCELIDSMPALQESEYNETLVIYLGDRHFKNHRIATPSNAVATLAHASRLRWVFLLDQAAIASWQKPQLTITVLTQKRLESLQRLTKSLVSTDFFGHTVDLVFCIDVSNDELAVVKYLTQFVWPHGRKTLRHRVGQASYVVNAMESWYPADNDDYLAFFEDDESVSPHWFHFVKLSLLASRYSSNKIAPGQLVALSLYTHRFAELVPHGPLNMTAKFPGNTPFLFQYYATWGEVVFPEYWREFQAYYDFRQAATGSEFNIPGSSSNDWVGSIKKFKLELNFARGYVMLYPNFVNQVSFSTNHFELGEHVHFESSKSNPLTVPVFGEADDWLKQWSGDPFLNIERRVLDIMAERKDLRTLRALGDRYRGKYRCPSGIKATVDKDGYYVCE